MLTFDQAKKDWNKIIPDYNKFQSNVYYKQTRFFLSKVDLVKLPHSGNEYAVYYYLVSLFNKYDKIEKNWPFIQYQVKNAKGMQLNIELKMEREEHLEFLNSNIEMIKKQFLFNMLDGEPDVDTILHRIDHYLDSTRPDINRVPIFMFMIQLSCFTSEKLGGFYTDKYLKAIENYSVMEGFYEYAYKVTKEEFLKRLINTKKEDLETNLKHNAELLSQLNKK